MIRTFYILVIVFLCLTLLTGCWSRKELNELGIVLAVALDQDPQSDGILLTAQVVKPGALKQEGGNGGEKEPVQLITAKGATIADAIKNMSKELDRKPFFSHNKLVVIDEQLARKGLLPLLDFWGRSTEIRPILWLFIAKGVPAREIISEKHGIENIQATYLNALIRRNTFHSEASTPSLLEFLKDLGSDTNDPFTGAVEIVDVLPSTDKEGAAKGVRLAGTAVFKKDKLAGFLTDRETRGLNWVIGEVKNGMIQVPSPKEAGKLITINIKDATCHIKPELINGNYSFTIKISEEGDIAEEQSLDDITKLPVLAEINQAQQQVIEAEVRDTIHKVQKEYGTDIFGFGKMLYADYPDEWQKIKTDWPDIFPHVEYTLKVTTKIRRTGLLQKSLIEKEGPEPEVNSRNRPYDMLKEE
ncbi:Ger(x)C family spore germination protein [Propionispora hippei]|uniref:Spore germination protein KC n=1 Tax=Propionispora hippei DSM 15287 TaxID=1123003 RepID=A0A1M6LKD3_9FIRM|nr:Ger(x)C family spore germination protein [Propionispora hippei]SHJ71667.1 spore germination protein KC [Propionispora hippei DSM 15287]